ncbi:ketoreductase domain-containing protein [Bacillus velezensis]
MASFIVQELSETRPLFRKTKHELSEVIAPKVHGALNLDHATKSLELDFFAVFSSVVSIAGNEGQCDYAYANGFLDHFAEYREQKRQNSLRKRPHPDNQLAFMARHRNGGEPVRSRADVSFSWFRARRTSC